MVLSENPDDPIYARHKDICKDLNMDSATTALAWDSYQSIKQHYTLEGDPIHWLGCAIYVACRKAKTPTVGHTGSFVRGNCVSLTRLLRLCELSIQQFFNKSKTWADMANMPVDFRKKIDALERVVIVSLVIFRKYHVIFTEIFKNPVDEYPRQHRSRKQRNTPCTPSRVFEFIWSLFVAIKGEFTGCSDDLVTSFHLLLACIDLAYNNALLSDRRDLLNLTFSGLPTNFTSPEYVKPTAPICIIDVLCKKYEGVLKDAKWVKEYSFKEAMQKAFDQNILQGDGTNFSGLFDAQNFDNNLKAAIKVYEEHVLNVGELDERIFLDEVLNTTSGSSNIMESQFNEDLQMKHLQPATPLTGRKYLKAKEQSKTTALAAATQSVVRLQTLLNGCLPTPSENLKKILSSCSPDPTEMIKQIVAELGRKFVEQYSQQGDQAVNVDLANKRLILSETLFWKLVENVLIDELTRRSDPNLSSLLEKPLFTQCMFACSIEIVIYSYNSQKKFPWTLQAFDLQGYYFYRVIELIIRTKDHLSRDVVKHLNAIEEQILESLAWESKSALWEVIESGEKVPCYEDTCLPGQLENGMQGSTTKKTIAPMCVTQSPMSSASERFQSPVLPPGSIKKKLFVDSKVKPGQSLLQNKTMVIVAVDEKGNQKYIPVQDIQEVNSVAQQPPPVVSNAKPKRQGSFPLFFRKFYYLAFVRLMQLLKNLNIEDINLKRKIFTCFEHTIVENTDLMKDRHLDQILMCAIYVILKVSDNAKEFSEIMQHYRQQPQAHSHVYRSVLLGKNIKVISENKDKREDEKVAPTELAGNSTTYEEEVRCDLIKFYNAVYIQREKQYALKFASANQDKDLHLSPLPVTKPIIQASPKRRVTDNVFIRPLEQKSSPSQVKQYSYYFSRSPSKDLKNINKLISSRIGKRLTGDELGEDVIPRKLQGLIEERLEQKKE